MAEEMDLFLGRAAREGTTNRAWTPQQNAVFHEVVKNCGNLEVVARAGSGKSTTILEAARRLPSNMDAGLTAFNRSIADELKAKAPDTLKVRTFHAAGFSILKSHDRHCTIDEQKGMNLAREVAGSNASQKLVTAIKRAASMFKSYLIENAADGLGILEDHDIEASAYASQEELAQFAIRAMTASKEMSGIVDFDDQVWLPIVLGLKPRYPFDIIFVDECHDMNEGQLRLAFSLAGGTGRIIVVGDPYQAVYQWRGAGPGVTQKMIGMLQAKQLPLTVTFRCAKKIVKEAQQIVADIEAAPNAEEGSVSRIQTNELIKLAKAGDVILSRSNAALIKQCTVFIRAGIKSNIMGRDLGQILSGMVTRSSASSIDDLREWIAEWKAKELAKAEKKDQDPQPILDRAACVEAFAESAKSIGEVQRNISVMFDDVKDEDRVLFSSTHRFKGMERDRVFLLRDTYLQSRPRIDEETGEKVWTPSQEEKNILYVAITRAKRELYYVSG